MAGIVLLALICLVVTDALSLNEHENSLLRRIVDRDLERVEAASAAALIQQVWRVRAPTKRRGLSVASTVAGTAAADARAAAAASPAAASPSPLRTCSTRVPSSVTVSLGLDHPVTVSASGSAEAAEVRAAELATTTQYHRLMLLHRVQRKREQRRLLHLEGEGTSDVMMRRLDEIERRVSAEMQAIRATQAAQIDVLARLTQRLEQLSGGSAGARDG